ncbi:MAG: class I SAM-dependent methyltransferase [Gemmatimonadales bacterium]|nr:MAG: class I SAM-dependent methyltransferase [Gemmatimonadales bacterium]
MNRDDWYRHWFGADYLALYPHRDRDEARQAVELLLSCIQLPADGRILDLACGAGRHLEALAAHGVRGVGLDLSSHLLARAREGDGSPCLVRADMRRIPFSNMAFHAVTSFFTSFGYFAHERDNRAVLDEVRRVLRPGGIFLLDFLNADRVVATLRPRDEQVIRGRRVVQERRLLEGERVVEKRILIRTEAEGEGVGPAQSYTERVRLYRAHELATLLEAAGYRVVQRYGDYAGGALGPDSPRVILLASLSPDS